MVLVEFDYVKQPIVYTIAGLMTVGGGIGIIVHGAYSENGGPTFIKSEYISMWLAAILVFISSQSFFIIFEYSKFPVKKGCNVVDIIYFSIVCVSSVITAICYEMVHKHDATVWSSLIAFMSLFNIVLAKTLIKVESKESDNSSKQEYNGIIIKENLVRKESKERIIETLSRKRSLVENIPIVEYNYDKKDESNYY